MSEVSKLVSTPSATENDSLMLAKETKKYNAEEFIDFLRSHVEFGLDEEDFEIIHNQKVNGRVFFKSTKQDFLDYGLKRGPVIKLLDFAKECRVNKLKAFSSYKISADAR